MKIELPQAEGAVAGDTFCALPWTQLRVMMDGSINPCCAFAGNFMRPNGKPYKVYEDNALDDVWNSDQMRHLRRDLAGGKMNLGCNVCWMTEASGGPSPRTLANDNWENRDAERDGATLSQQAAAWAALDHKLPRAPVSMQLEVGNLCNLKCRMCCGLSSSRIARDTVHSKWADEWAPETEHAWIRKPGIIHNELLRHAEQLRYLHFYGGETLIIKEVGDVVQALVDAGEAHHITIVFQSNGTTAKAPWLRLTEAFEYVGMSLSIDGYGEINEYIRYPARWQSIVENIEAFRQMPKVAVSVASVFQAYNALNIVDLFRFFDAAGLSIYANPLSQPDYLDARVLPLLARQVAADRLQIYADNDCPPENRDHVLSLIAWLNLENSYTDERLLRDFMLFTNDLDASRGQSFRRTYPELVSLLADAGYPWIDETRHTELPLLPTRA
jgi:pyruvate-formate lyase-activating enzyme